MECLNRGAVSVSCVSLWLVDADGSWCSPPSSRLIWSGTCQSLLSSSRSQDGQTRWIISGDAPCEGRKDRRYIPLGKSITYFFLIYLFVVVVVVVKMGIYRSDQRGTARLVGSRNSAWRSFRTGELLRSVRSLQDCRDCSDQYICCSPSLGCLIDF